MTSLAVQAAAFPLQFCRSIRAHKSVAPPHSSSVKLAKALKGTTTPILLPGKPTQRVIRADVGSASVSITSETQLEEPVPTPVVNIDQHSESDATIVYLQFGDRLGALLDTTNALINLGLNVKKATIQTEEGVGINRFHITDVEGRKVEDVELLEDVRLTIIENLLKYHPESSPKLAMGKKVANLDACLTTVAVQPSPDGDHSVLYVESPDRPGLLAEIVSVLRDININVVSAEIDTEGLVAKDEFYVNYHGLPLDSNMTQLVTNALQYYLTKKDVAADESY